jgi:hypothetical protein
VFQDNQRSNPRHSRLAIASLLLALAALGILLFLMRGNGGEQADPFTSAYMVRRVLLFGLPLLGSIIGVIAALKSNRRRLIAIVGTALNVLALVLIIAT